MSGFSFSFFMRKDKARGCVALRCQSARSIVPRDA